VLVDLQVTLGSKRLVSGLNVPDGVDPRQVLRDMLEALLKTLPPPEKK
jgi:hypothetical protein